MKVGHKANLLVAVLLACELLFVFILYSMLEQAEADAQRMNESRAILTNINRLMRTVVALSLRIRSLTLASDNETRKLIRQMYLEMSDLEQACSTHPAERATVIKVRNTVDEGMAGFAKAQEYIRTGQWDEAKDKVDKIKPLLTEMADKFEEIRKDQETIEIRSAGIEAKQRRQLRNVLTSGLAINIFMAFVLVSLFNRGITSRLRHMLRNTKKLSVGDPLEPPMGGDDEIAHLDKAFNEVANALTAAMKKQTAIFQHAIEVIGTLDEQDKFSEVSASSLRVFGYAPSELQGMRFLDILVADQVGHAKQLLHDLRTSNPDVEFESKVRKKDGPIITVLFSAQYAREEKTVFLVALDITERKQKQEILEEAETRLRLIIESLPIGLIMTNLRGIVKLTNPVTERMLSMQREEIADRPIADLFKIQGEHDLMPFLEKCEGRAVETQLVLLDRETAPVRQITAEISVRKIDTNEGQRLLVLIVDVSERAEIERMKQQFVAVVSHELKTPLMAVQVYLELLETGAYGSLNETGAQKLKAVDDNVTRLTKLIKDLLDVERLESGTLSSRKRPINLNDIFENTKETVLPSADKSGIEVSFSEADIELNADPDRLVQVLVNLIANALKFSPQGSTVQVVAEDEEETVVVSVTDQGRGIPNEFREKIFERFQQVSLDDASKKGGAGLGLAICKSIIQQHEGTIAVDSEDGKGSRFWFRLPKQ
jgi:PAS domain S-box-containing protein